MTLEKKNVRMDVKKIKNRPQYMYHIWTNILWEKFALIKFFFVGTSDETSLNKRNETECYENFE